jgi:hypothetical protein
MGKAIYLGAAFLAIGAAGAALGLIAVSSQSPAQRTAHLAGRRSGAQLAAPTDARKASQRPHQPQAPTCPARLPHARSSVMIAVHAAPPYFSRKCYYLIAGSHVIIKFRDPGFRLHGLVISRWNRPAIRFYHGEPVWQVSPWTITSIHFGGASHGRFRPHPACSHRIIRPGRYAVQDVATPPTAIATLVVQPARAR